MNAKELERALENAKIMTTKYIERMPELAEFIEEHDADFQRLWVEAHTEKKYDTATAMELTKFVAATQKLSFAHFVLHKH